MYHVHDWCSQRPEEGISWNWSYSRLWATASWVPEHWPWLLSARANSALSLWAISLAAEIACLPRGDLFGNFSCFVLWHPYLLCLWWFMLTTAYLCLSRFCCVDPGDFFSYSLKLFIVITCKRKSLVLVCVYAGYSPRAAGPTALGL